MSVYARIEKGLVAELFTPPVGLTIEQCFAPGLVWQAVPDGLKVAPKWAFDGTHFTEPPPDPVPPSISQQKPLEP